MVGIIKEPLSIALMLAIISAFLIVFLPSASAIPPPPLTTPPILEWSHTYGGPLFDEGRAVLQTADGGYIIAGATSSLSKDGSYEGLLFKTDANGTLQWLKTYGDDDNNTMIYAMVNTSDGGYALTGKSWPKAGNSTGSGEDVILIKTDAAGNMQWKTYYGEPKNDSGGESLVQSWDGGYAIVGYTESYGAGGEEVYLVKTDAGGNLLWNMTYGSKYDDIGYYITESYDNSYQVTSKGYDNVYLLAGQIVSDATDSQSDHNIYLMEVAASDGSILDETGYAYSGPTICRSILNGTHSVMANVVNDGHYNIALTDQLGSINEGDWGLATYGGDNDTIGYSSILYGDGVITAGYTESFGNGMKDVYLLKTWPTSNYMGGGLQWQQAYGGDKDDIAYSVAPTSDGGLIVVGSTESFGYGGEDVYLLKIMPNPTALNFFTYPNQNSTRDNPISTNIVQFQQSPTPSAPAATVKPTPGIDFLTTATLFIALPFALRKIKR